jgi:hypothetical protein
MNLSRSSSTERQQPTASAHAITAPAKPPQLFKQQLRMNGLGEVGEVVSSVCRLVREFRQGYMTGNQEHFAERMLVAYLNRCVEPAYARHDDVADQQVRGECSSNCDSFFATVSFPGFVSFPVKHPTQRVGDCLFIVNHKNPGFACGLHISSFFRVR